MTWALAWEVLKRIGGLMPVKDWLYAALLALIVGYHLYAVHEARVAGRAEGAKAATEQCEADKKTAQAAHDKEVADLKKHNQEVEQQQATELAAVGEGYAAQLQTITDQARRDVAAARSGALKLRVAGVCSNPSGGRSTPEAAASAGQRDGPSICELPGALTERLLGIADDADATVKQLSACQAIVTLDRKGQS